MGIFLVWHHMNIFGLPPLACRRVFLVVRSWWAAYEASTILKVPFTLVFQYLSHQDLSASTEIMRKFKAYALAELVV